MIEKESFELFNTCLTIARKYHEGQLDKAGVPYIEHCKRVGEYCFNELCDPDYLDDETIKFAKKCKYIGYLHDVLEDTDCTIDILREANIPEDIIEGIISVTRKEGESYGDFIKRAAKNKYGKYVKYYDLIDNLDIKRFKKISIDDINRINKYLKWYNYLNKELTINI